MLCKDPFVIKPATFKLIQELQQKPFLKEFYLVGGTSLALQMGHRNSIDIDLFTQNEFDDGELIENLSSYFSVKIVYSRANTIISIIDGIKCDFIRHNYKFLREPIQEENITFLSKEDIVAMKLNAIVQSGKRLKDFIDIYYLLEFFSITEMIAFYVEKYPNMNPMIPLKAVTFFHEIDPNLDPPILKKPISLSKIKKRILEASANTNKKYKP